MIKRKLFPELIGHLDSREMSIIVGPRQAGKTTLMELVKAHLDRRAQPTLFLNLDVEWDRPHFESQAALIKKIELELGNVRGYVFIDEIYHSVIEKDIAYLFKLDKPDVFSALVRILAGQIGQLINYSELSSTLNVSFQTVKKYIWYAQKIFLIEVLPPFSRNIKKEISKSPVPYFWDIGLRNHALGLFGQIQSPGESGFLFANLLFLILKKNLG
jgi:predicted AAA+ superfamily ATPase